MLQKLCRKIDFRITYLYVRNNILWQIYKTYNDSNFINLLNICSTFI